MKFRTEKEKGPLKTRLKRIGEYKGSFQPKQTATPKKVRKPKRKAEGKSAKELYDSKRKSFRESKIDEFSVGGITKAAKTLINKYKPKIKNEKEDYGLYSKQDYSDVVKNYEKTQQRKKRNRAGAVIGGAATAVTVQSKKDKENKK